jgi:hypothetical protein
MSGVAENYYKFKVHMEVRSPVTRAWCILGLQIEETSVIENIE